MTTSQFIFLLSNFLHSTGLPIKLTFCNLGCIHGVHALLVVGPLPAFKQFKFTPRTTCQFSQILLIWMGNGALRNFKNLRGKHEGKKFKKMFEKELTLY